MRIQSVLALTAISAVFFACSSGGVGAPPPFEESPIGGAYGGAKVPALGPELTAPSGGGGGENPPVDSGGGGSDTGGGADTGGPKDTGGTVDICNQPSKCTGDAPATDSEIAQCRSLISGASCPTQYKALFTCFRLNAVCDGSNMTDATATGEACSSQQTALNTCVSGG